MPRPVNQSTQFMRLACERGVPGCACRAGSITLIKPGPFRIDTREDRVRRTCRSPAALQGLSAIGIPNRKTPARHIGLRCSIRGKSGGGRSGGEPYRRIGQTAGLSKSRRALRVAPDFALFFSFLFSSTLAHSSRLELEK